MVELYMADHGEFPTMEDYDYKEASNSDVHSLTAKSRHNTGKPALLNTKYLRLVQNTLGWLL